MNLFAIIEFTLILVVSATYIIQCPFNKVEESFNTHAVHDIINILPGKLPHHDRPSLNTSSPVKEVNLRAQLPWDHIIFPGVVPRTFVGALLVGLPMKFIKILMQNGFIVDRSLDQASSDLSVQFVLQMGSRFALASFVALSLGTVARAIQRRFGLLVRACFLVVTVTQFHYLFYSSRFIPNTYAAIIANLVFASWLDRHYSKAIVYMAVCVIVFRFDTIIFFGWLLLDGVFIKRYLKLNRVLLIGIPAGLASILLTILVDSFMWTRLVWPELEGLYFNLWLNKSSEWGTQPYLWYFYSCLPRAHLSGTPFILLADRWILRDYLLPTIAFIMTYSVLPHKELRFILFIVPVLNLCIASGLVTVHSWLSKISSHQRLRYKTSIVTCLFLIIMGVTIMTNIMASYILAKISSLNYPGGHAAISVATSRDLYSDKTDVAVYVNNLAAQTGFSRFLQIDGVYYCKPDKLDSRSFTKPYRRIFLVLEPEEAREFLHKRCNSGKTRGSIYSSWMDGGRDDRCQIPNQSEMLCSISETIKGFRSVDARKLLKLGNLDGYIKTDDTLHIVRCIKPITQEESPVHRETWTSRHGV